MGQHSPSVHKYQPGDVLLERYQLERQLAVGGMGELWRAVNLALEQPVAVKLLRSAARNPAGAARLLREARVAARLQHRAIIRVFDAGTTATNDPFLVMELLEGEDAGTLLEDSGPLDAVRAVQLMIPVLSGLSVAHAQGVVHRDLKPDNIFLARLSDGTVQPKLIDFGVAHVGAQLAASKLTTAGMLLGTPEYMAPEQIECRDDIDARADVWAVGITLYQLIAGAVPFSGETLLQIFDAIMEAHVPFPTRARGLDGGLWSILTDCLRRNRDERFASVDEVERALTAWLAKRGVTEDYARHSLVAAAAVRPSTLVSTLAPPPPRAESETRPAGPTLDRAIFSVLEKKPT
jgi:serine/threonine protein kinase